MKGKYIVFDSVANAAVCEFDVPAPQRGEVLLRNEYTVISAGTERANLMNLPNTSMKFPFYPGYSGLAHVQAVGEGVENVKVGDRVLAYYTGHRSHAVQSADTLFLVNDAAVESIDAALIVIAAMSLQGVRKLKIELGESAMIIGQGILGAFAVQFAALSGAIPIIVTDFDRKRRELALELGADVSYAPDEPGLRDKILDITEGRGVDAIVEVTGSAAALQQGLEVVRRQGRISLLGCTRNPDVNIDFYRHVHLPGISLYGAHTSTRPKHESYPGHWTNEDDYRTLIKLMASRKLKARPIISEVVPPECAPEIYRNLAESRDPPLGIIFDWKQMEVGRARPRSASPATMAPAGRA